MKESAPSSKGKAIVIIFLMAGIISTFGTTPNIQPINYKALSS